MQHREEAEVIMEARASIRPLTKPQRILVILVGVAFVGVGVFVYAEMFNFGRGVSRTTGIIVSTLKEESTTGTGSQRRTSVSYRPIVEFDADGTTYKFLADVSSSSYEAGQEVKVNYDPEDPARSPSLAGAQELIFPGVGALCGVLAIVLGVLAPPKTGPRVDS
jgi:hypothetical protein